MPATAWSDAAAYEGYVGQWSRLIAPQFVEWLAAPPSLRWLDVACGTGALTEAILHTARPTGVAAIDRSPGYLDFARQQVSDPRAQFETGSAEALPYTDSSFDIAVSGLALNFLDASLALAEQRRVVKEGGTIAAYLWDYAGAYDYARFFWEAAVAVDPTAESYDPRRRFRRCNGAGLEQLFAEHGLTEVVATNLDATASFPTFDAYWQALDARQGSMSEYLSGISEETRAAVRTNLSARVSREASGAVHLKLRAVAAKGQR